MSKKVTRADLTLSGISLFLSKGVNPDEALREFAKYGGIKGFCVRAPDLSEVFNRLEDLHEIRNCTHS